MYLIQVFLPLYDNDNKKIPAGAFQSVAAELTKTFHGITGYTRAPVEGLWTDQDATTRKDDLIIYEVMVEQLDRGWWRNYRQTLEAAFSQEQIIVRAQPIELL